jgi:hypothetical protein
VHNVHPQFDRLSQPTMSPLATAAREIEMAKVTHSPCVYVAHVDASEATSALPSTSHSMQEGLLFVNQGASPTLSNFCPLSNFWFTKN